MINYQNMVLFDDYSRILPEKYVIDEFLTKIKFYFILTGQAIYKILKF